MLGRPRAEGPSACSAGLVRSLDERSGRAPARKTLRYVFPDHWSFLLGEVALYCFVVLVGTGVYLTFFFHSEHGDDALPRLIPAASGAADD